MIFAELSQQTEQNRISKGSRASGSRRSWSSNNPYKATHKRHDSKNSQTESMMSRGHPLRGSLLRERDSQQSIHFQYQAYNPPNVVVVDSPPSTPSYPAAFSYIARFLNQSGYLSTPFWSREFLPQPPPKDRKSSDILKWLGSNRLSRASAPTEISTMSPPLSPISSPDLPFVSATDLSSQIDPLPHQILHQRHFSEPSAQIDRVSQHQRHNSESLMQIPLSPLPEHHEPKPKARAAIFSENFSSRSDIQYKAASIYMPVPTVKEEPSKVRQRKKLSKDQKSLKSTKSKKEKKLKPPEKPKQKLQEQPSIKQVRDGVVNWDNPDKKKRAACSCM